jgi:small subunit ribosomal protein S17
MSDEAVNEIPVTDQPAIDDATVAPEAAAEAPAEQAATAAPVAAAAVAVAAPEDEDGPEARKNARKVREGVVVSISMEKTAVVAIIDRVRHRRYVKTVQRTKRFYAHDENNETRLGDRVRIVETRPLSKLKRWRVVEILERAK